MDETDWSKLHHAYGRATDTPTHLRALLKDDPEARKKALEHLWSAVIHQGTPWTATGPVALVIAGIIFDERIEPVRANLVSFLSAVAEATEQSGWNDETLEETASRDIEALLESEDEGALYEDENATNTFYARSVLGCIRALPDLMSVMLDGLDDPNHRVRMWAAMGASTLFKRVMLASQARDLPARILGRAASARNKDERCTHVLAVGDLDTSTVQFLDDHSPAIRLCAALAPALSKNQRATDELLAALETHAADVDNWFTDRPPQFSMHPRFYVVARLINEVKSFDKLADAAVAVLAVTSKECVDHDWGPLLAAAFSDGDGIVKTEGQRNFLRALTRRSDLWDARFGNPLKWFKKAGLPYDRFECIDRVGRT